MTVLINATEVVPSLNIGTFPTHYFGIDSEGRVDLVGNSRITKPLWISANSLEAPSVSPATKVEGIWEFSDTVDDAVIGMKGIPWNRIDYAEPPIMYLGWSTPTPDPGDNSKKARWQVEYLWRGMNEDMNAPMEATLVGNHTCSTVANGLKVSAFSLSDLASGDLLFKFEIKRRADQAGDTLDGVNVYLHAVCLIIVLNKLGGYV